MLSKHSVNITFFVAKNGNDSWSGKLFAPNKDKTDGPFASITRARDAIRQLKKDQGGLKEPIIVMVRGTNTMLLGLNKALGFTFRLLWERCCRVTTAPST